jgi:hypothetical protein
MFFTIFSSLLTGCKLVAFSIISCSNEKETLSSDVESVENSEMQKYARLFEEYTNIKNDGVTVTDKSEIIQLIKTAKMTTVDSRMKEIHLYSSKEKYKEITNIDLDKEVVEESTDGLIKNPSGLVPDDEGYYAVSKNNTSAKSTLYGYSGLGNVADNPYFTGFANRVFAVIKYNNSGNTYFTEIANRPELNNDYFNGIKCNASTGSVTINPFNLYYAFNTALTFGSADIKVFNDTDETKYVTFYSGSNHTGSGLRFWIYTNDDAQVSYILNLWGYNRIRSTKVTNTL